jgi:hypothetical protein
MIINEIVISRLEEFIKRPIPEDYAPFRRELMELIQEGTISLDNPNLLRYLLAVDFRIRDYQPSPDPLLGVTLSESAVKRIPTGQIHLSQTQALEAVIAIILWRHNEIEDHGSAFGFLYGGFEEAERTAHIETGLLAQELSLAEWLSQIEFLEFGDKLYPSGIGLSPSVPIAGFQPPPFSYYATDLFRSCITVDATVASNLSKLIGSRYFFEVLSHFRHDFSRLLTAVHADEFFKIRKLIDQKNDLPSMKKHSSEAFAIRQLDWMITKYRPNLTKELEARSQLPIWTDEDTRRN